MKPIFMVMPTWNNDKMCAEATRTLYEYTDFAKYGELLVVDHSDDGEADPVSRAGVKYGFRVYWPGQNNGWMRGVNYGLESRGRHPYFTMANDDLLFPQDKQFWPRTIALFEGDPKVMGVGPISNYVMGPQFQGVQLPGQVGEVSYLIGFCATYRTSVLEVVGPLDTTLPGGDDLDLSIRVRREGGKLLCDRRSFVYHYGSVTGNRVHSDWDTHESQLKTANALILKHGFKGWYRGVSPMWEEYLPAEPSSVTDAKMGSVLSELDKLAVFIGSIGATVIEGSCTPKQIEFILEHTKDAIQVCEIGMNAGLSACAMLKGNPEMILFSFDLGEWPYTPQVRDYLRREFTPRFISVFGDSKTTVPRVVGGLVFDFAFIDGGHDEETAYVDICNLASRTRKMMIDDIQMPPVRRALARAVEEKTVSNVEEFMDMGSQVPRHWALVSGGVK